MEIHGSSYNGLYNSFWCIWCQHTLPDKGLPWQQSPCYPFYLFRRSFFSEVILKAFFSPLHHPHRTQCWHNCSDKFDPELWRQTSRPPPQCDCTRASPNGHWFLLTCEAPFPHFVSVCELCLCWPVAPSCVGINVRWIYMLPSEGLFVASWLRVFPFSSGRAIEVSFSLSVFDLSLKSSEGLNDYWTFVLQKFESYVKPWVDFWLNCVLKWV